MFDIKEIIVPETLDECLYYLNNNENYKIIAGGTDVLIKLHHGKLNNCSLISIGNIDELCKINILENGDIYIGAAVTFGEIFRDEIINENIPMLAEAAVSMGGPQIRNVATIGGNICNGAVSADSAPALFALDAMLILESISGVRYVQINDFYEGPGRVKIQSNEILSNIIIKKESYENFKGKYIKFSNRKALDISMLGVAVNIKLDNINIIDLKIALGVAASTPIRCIKAETYAVGKILNTENIEHICNLLLDDANPRNSWRGSKDYRLHLIKVLVNRILSEQLIKSEV